jgi:hypothetical protein
MTDERYNYLERTLKSFLTMDEINEGWHWCNDYDYMLVGPDMPEWENCTCLMNHTNENNSSR